MKFTFEDILKNQNKKILEPHTQFEIFQIQESFNGLNNQNRIGWEFMESSYFDINNRVEDFIKYLKNWKGEDLWKKTNSLWHIPQDGIHTLDKKIAKLSVKSIKYEDLEPYFKYLAWHISIDLAKTPQPINYKFFPCRWGYNRYISEHDYDNVIKVQNNIDLINKKLNEEDFEWESLEMEWHSFLALAWTLIQCGLGKYALDIVDPLFELHTKEYKENKSIISFVMPALNQDYKLRIKGTLSWIKAFAHKQIGENEKYYNTLNNYVKYYEKVGCDHYNVSNRVLEASVLVYKQKPTQENRERCLKLLQHTCSLFMDEPTECIRERGLVIYDLAKTLFKEEIYETYNN